MGQEFGAAGKRAEVVVQRHPTDLYDLLVVGELVLDLVLVERHLNGVVLGQSVTLPSEKCTDLEMKVFLLTLSEFNFDFLLLLKLNLAIRERVEILLIPASLSTSLPL